MSLQTIPVPAAIASSRTIPNDSRPAAGEAGTPGGPGSASRTPARARGGPGDPPPAHPAGHDVAPRLALLGARADDEEPAGAACLAQDPVGLQQVEEPLPRLEPADEQEVPRAVLPAGGRAGPLQAGGGGA